MNSVENDNRNITVASADCKDSNTDTTENTENGGKIEKRKKPRRAPFISSIKRRTMVNYIIYTVIILAVLWIAFLFSTFGLYGTTAERDVRDTGEAVTAELPSAIPSGNSQEPLALKLTRISRSHSAAIAVFSFEETGELALHVMTDSMGGTSTQNRKVFDSIVGEINFKSFFVREGNVRRVSTPIDTYMCYGAVRSVATDSDGQTQLYVLVIKTYSVLNPDTVRVIYILIACTAGVIVIACVFSYFASRYQTRRLIDFSQKAKRIAGGDYNIRFSGGGYDEFENLASALNAAKDNLQKTENMQRDIIANVTHDIRTPITMIRAYAEMLRDMPVDEQKRKKTANTIIAEADRLTTLTEDILNYSKLNSGVAEFKFESCNLSDIAIAVIQRFDIWKRRDGMIFETEIAKTATVTADKQRIEQVLYNLINNAVNYCGDDKTVILRVQKAADANAVRVEVSDHGKGIAPNEIDDVWERYYRASHAKRVTVGSGLGLSICKNILEAHAARYGVSSELGTGTTFWFELDTVN